MKGIEIKSLRKKIKGIEIIDNIDMNFEPGRLYGIHGRKFCGKSMILRSISGLIIPDEGTISIDGEVLYRDIKVPRSIGALIETPSFLSRYTGYRNLSMLAKLDGTIKDEDVKDAMMRVGLNPEEKKPYRKYSLDMRQKLGIANAIMGSPYIIILDEPTNALNDSEVAALRTELQKLRNDGSIIIIADNNKYELEYLCDTIYEITAGKVTGCEVIGA